MQLGIKDSQGETNRRCDKIEDIIKDLRRLSNQTWQEFSVSLGINQARITNLGHAGIKNINDSERSKIESFAISNIVLHSHITYLVKTYPDTFTFYRKKHPELPGLLRKWANIFEQSEGPFNGLMVDRAVRRFVLITLCRDKSLRLEMMFVKRASSDSKLIEFRTYIPRTSHGSWDQANGYFFDTGETLFAFARMRTFGLRSTQLKSIKSGGKIELRGLRMSSNDGQPFAYRMVGIEIDRSISSTVFAEIAFGGNREMVEALFPDSIRHPRNVRFQSAVRYLEMCEIEESGLFGGYKD